MRKKKKKKYCGVAWRFFFSFFFLFFASMNTRIKNSIWPIARVLAFYLSCSLSCWLSSSYMPSPPAIIFPLFSLFFSFIFDVNKKNRQRSILTFPQTLQLSPSFPFLPITDRPSLLFLILSLMIT